ncbi:hypothetical protein ACSL103130_00680 [Actinomyces slackii]|uniref:Uncharacterized protein n=2 Tax=Actinomyces slackii TaxID=52774 RepID=A0A3S4SFJ4_9ACTO|nr:Uncharacterised protein [Actinomyces slackii]
MRFRHMFSSPMMAVMAFILLLCQSIGTPAHAMRTNSGGSSEESADGSVTITVSVESTSASGGSSGGGGGATTTSGSVETTVKPICYYKPSYTNEQVIELYDDLKDRFKWSEKTRDERRNKLYPGAESYVGQAGQWYKSFCDRTRAEDDEQFRAAVKAFAPGRVYAKWVPAGSPPPIPPVDGKTLARAAMKAITIPPPTIDRNPRLDGSEATVVGYETWVWATGETPSEVRATATAGTSSAQVTAASTGLKLEAPDSQATCTGFGRPWTSDLPSNATSNCTLVFTRSSAHLGGTTPLTVSVNYHTTFTASDGTSGGLGVVSTRTETSIPVAEVQTLNTTDD